MYGSLELPAAKLRRAVHHYRTLKDIHWGVDHRRRPVTRRQVDAEGLEYEFRVGDIEPLNPDVSLILGDAATTTFAPPSMDSPFSSTFAITVERCPAT